MCTELESVKEDLSSTQQSAKLETKKLQQQLNAAEERLQTLTAEKEAEKVIYLDHSVRIVYHVLYIYRSIHRYIKCE